MIANNFTNFTTGWLLAWLCAGVSLVAASFLRRAAADSRRLDGIEKHLANEVRIGFDAQGSVRIYDPWGEVVGVGGDLRAALDNLQAVPEDDRE